MIQHDLKLTPKWPTKWREDSENLINFQLAIAIQIKSIQTKRNQKIKFQLFQMSLIQNKLNMSWIHY